MTTPKTTEQLAHQIEALVADYIDHGRQAAKEALENAFSSATANPTATRPTTIRKVDSSPQRTPRRTAEQLAALGEELYALICNEPGESMAVFADKLGIAVRELHRPMSKLRDDGRIRSVGQRTLTRYFPAIGSRASA